AIWPALPELHLEQLDPRTPARRLALVAGYCGNTLAQYDKGEAYAARCVAIAAQTEGAQIEWVRGCNVLGVAKLYQNAVHEARVIFERLLPAQRALGNRKGEVMALNNLAFTYFWLGEVEQAERIFLETLAIARDDQNEASVGRELAALAECAYEQGNLELAID